MSFKNIQFCHSTHDLGHLTHIKSLSYICKQLQLHNVLPSLLLDFTPNIFKSLSRCSLFLGECGCHVSMVQMVVQVHCECELMTTNNYELCQLQQKLMCMTFLKPILTTIKSHIIEFFSPRHAINKPSHNIEVFPKSMILVRIFLLL